MTETRPDGRIDDVFTCIADAIADRNAELATARAEAARLRTALEQIAILYEGVNHGCDLSSVNCAYDMRCVACRALEVKS